MPSSGDYEYQISDGPVTEVNLPTTRNDAEECSSSRDPLLQVLGATALALAAAGLIVLT